jgi:replicative DNA helicase
MQNNTENTFIYDAVNEMLVIGAAITDPGIRKRLVHQIAPDEFIAPNHGVIWRAVRKLSDNALEYTPEVIRRFIIDEGGTEDVCEYLTGVEATVPDNLDYHLQTLQWDATRARVLQNGVPLLLKDLQDPKALQGDVISSSRSITKSLEGGARRFIHKPSELHNEYRAELELRRLEKNVYPLGHLCFDDNLSEGFSPGNTTVTAGLSGAGKSTLWFVFALMLAKLGRRVLYCCWEMSAKSILDVGTSYMTGIPLIRIVQGNLSDDETSRINKASRWINSRIRFMGNPFFAKDNTRKPSNQRNLDILEGYIAESACNVAIYDLWARMLVYRSNDDVESALYRMQAMHKEYRVHGIILHQIRLKDVEKRTDKRPTRESIKGTSAYVEVPDLVFGIHREGQFKRVDDNTIETICLKQRKGKANWAIRWGWNGETCFVGSPEIISYDPGIENAVGIGDISSIRSKGSRYNQIGRRE